MRTRATRGWYQQLTATFALAVLLAAASARAADAIEPTNACHGAGNLAVRSQSPVMTAAIEFGVKRSPTLADELDRLQRTDLVAYVETAHVAYSGVAAYVTFISKTAACRYVRIVVTPHVNLSQMAALLGHELQHVLEIANHPEVVDAQSLSGMYERIGRHAHVEGSYDSAEAIQIGRRVQAELFGEASARSSPTETER